MDKPIIVNKISAIDNEVINKICSGQVVLDLSMVIKELIENSLDSGATSIQIKLKDYGKTCITVIDNGSGVLEKDFEGLGLRHHTSKLQKFSDLLQVKTFGFRGEALSSLCSLSNLSIITKHASSQHGFKLQFDKNGNLISKKENARQQGTSVYVEHIFKNLPVRSKEFERNIKKEFTKMIQILYSYCLVSIGVKITCINSLENKSANVLVTTTGTNNLMDNITAVFGRKNQDNLIEIELESPDKDTLEEYNLCHKTFINFKWKCFVSNCSHSSGRSSPDRQFFYVNGRPCVPTKIIKLINHIYHKYNNKQYPFIYLDIQLNQSYTDINVTPDKRTILFTQEQVILATIKSNFQRTWNNAEGKFTVKTLDELKFTIKKRNFVDSSENTPPTKKPFIINLNKSTKYTQETCAIETIKSKFSTLKSKEKIIESNEKCIDFEKSIENIKSKMDNVESKQTNIEINRSKHLEYDFETNTPNRSQLEHTEMQISLKSIKDKMIKLQEIQVFKKEKKNILKYRAQIDSLAVEKELERELTKESFKQMQVIGQFNLGFILTRHNDDIFIIDQHASDEQFRFEKLSNETKIKTQKLILQKQLNLATVNENILIENQQIFEDNGFKFYINMKEIPGCRVYLTGIPVSFDWQFGQEDIEELIFLIREGGTDGSNSKNIPRPSRVRQMLASRACRSAIMIGKALNLVDMHRLLLQMSQMNKPWNCPHGRPTIRHLLSLTLLK